MSTNERTKSHMTNDNSVEHIITDDDSNAKQAASLNSSMHPKIEFNIENSFGNFSTSSSSKIFPFQSYTTQQCPTGQSYPNLFYEYLKDISKHAEINRGVKNNNSMCQVCGDSSNGKHYGISACNGCSGFFKRSVRRKLIYRCHANTGRCTIDKANRNQCQSCRLRKCLQMGMVKEAVQHERQPRTGDTQFKMNLVDHHQNYNEGNLFFSTINKHKIISNSSPYEMNISPLIQHRNEYDLVNKRNDTVYIISSQILLMMIEWIRHLPTFLNLPVCDQFILLEESWSELFLLWAIQYSIPLDNGGPIFQSVKLHYEHEDEKLLHDLFYIFKQLQVDSIEFAYLKTIVLFRFDIRTLNEIKLIETIQDQAQITLAQYLRIHNPTQPTRFGRLLLTLPLLRRISSLFIEQAYFSRIIGKISMSKLLADMLKN